MLTDWMRSSEAHILAKLSRTQAAPHPMPQAWSGRSADGTSPILCHATACLAIRGPQATKGELGQWDFPNDFSG